MKLTELVNIVDAVLLSSSKDGRNVDPVLFYYSGNEIVDRGTTNASSVSRMATTMYESTRVGDVADIDRENPLADD